MTSVKRPNPPLDRERLRHRNQNRSTVASGNAMVCASQPLAAIVGIDILKAGGNCVDAAIAANAMLGLVEPAMCGIGGDLFALVWSEAEQQLHGLNASGRAPLAWTLAEAERRGLERIPPRSPLAWTVPGCVSGWAELNQRFGALPLARCLEPAIEYARTGFPVSPIIAESLAPLPEADPSWARVFQPGGVTLRFGDVFKNPALAHAYGLIADGGAGAFYEGEIAERIVAKSTELGGYMSVEDFARHRADWVAPVRTRYRGYEVWELPPNGQGIAVLQMLNLLEHFDVPSLVPNSAEHLHLFIEAKKLVYEDRARLYADPEFADVPIEWLISKDYGARRVRSIDPAAASSSVAAGMPPLDSDTVYLTAADRHGNMISLIQSIYESFGSGICPEGLGCALHNRGQSFALRRDHPNRLEPHKRPFHTIIPGFVTEAGRPRLSFGVMGGDFQPEGQVQVLMNMLDFGLSPQQAGEQPRVSHAGSSDPRGLPAMPPGLVYLEHGMPAATRDGLRARGHVIADDTLAFGGYQAIWRLDRPLRYFGGSDPRKDGCALGY
jgi:gamma-glutamyltranspeptidase / glutathione hydrolase